ncbi:MAG: phosphodiester glycosidase family protein [Actinomycetota bacterium]|nr:phosphodiester glycosidase family protein [Actinomycetota bacterium]
MTSCRKLARIAVPFSALATSALLGFGGTLSAAVTSRAATAVAETRSPKALPAPRSLRPFHPGAPRPDGIWHPAGRPALGRPAVYETTLQPPGSPYEAGIAWMDTNLLRAQLYSGSVSPGYGPWKYTAPVSPAAALALVAAFNGGFKFPDTRGGYYSEGRMVHPLRRGGASFVIYRDGRATVGQWERDVFMTGNVIAVRQNLTLLVDHGRAVRGLNPNDTSAWGATLGGIPNVWRSGVGVTSDGALVYVTGPSLRITQLAALLVRAGAVRAMTLDMNPDWTVFVTYSPSPPTAAATPDNGRDLISGTVQGPYTFFEPWWARDFFTMSVR